MRDDSCEAMDNTDVREIERLRFIVREHGRTPNPQPLEPMQYRGRIEAGAVYEQAVAVEDDAGQRLRLRRVELHLERATEDG